MVRKTPEERGTLEDRIGGGTIGCDQDSLWRWHQAYYRTVRGYAERGRFIGKDQSMMATTCLDTDLCLLVQGDEHWIRLQEWFRGETAEQPLRMNLLDP